MFDISIPNTQLSLEDFIFEIEKQLRDLDYEVGIVVKNNKEIVLVKEGNFNKIVFLLSEKGLIANNIFTHNHPQNTPHSSEDLQFAYDFELQEIRVVTNHSTYRVIPTVAGWKHSILVAEIKEKLVHEIIEKYKKQEITRQEADKLYNELGFRIAKILGYFTEILDNEYNRCL